jgi:murein DD-endopeptidase MepM/ murein hydrolase activator NlpD
MRGIALFAALLVVGAGPALGAGDPAVAALQTTLHARGLYAGAIDGVRGPATTAALRKAQRRAGVTADGIVGPKTRRALRLRALGSRPLRLEAKGYDVLVLQYALAWHGFPSGTVDGRYGPRTERAVMRFQRYAGLAPDGLVGPGTLVALHRPPPRIPMPLAWPLQAPVTDGFGPRGSRFHTGLDLPAPAGTGVAAAAPGRVAYAGWLAGGWGLLVTIAHPGGMRTLYAHLSRIDVHVGDEVEAGWQVGLVGATGDATGPHLHFEVRVRDAAVDPLPALRAPTASPT